MQSINTERPKRKRYDPEIYESNLNLGEEYSDTEWTSVSSTSDTYRASKKKRKQRFTWTDELHIKFVTSIFDCGLKTSSPKLLHQLMEPGSISDVPTTEHIKSHLQKYRANMQKYRKEIVSTFTDSYNAAIKQPDNQLRNLMSSSSFSSSSTSLTSLDNDDVNTGRESWMLQKPPSNNVIDAASIESLTNNSYTPVDKLLEVQSNVLKQQRLIQLHQAQLQEQLTSLNAMQEKLHDKIVAQVQSPVSRPSIPDFPLDSMLSAEDLDFLF